MTSRASPSCGSDRPRSASRGEATATATAVADGFLRVLDHLAEKPQAVLEAAAIFVGAVVVAPLQECLSDRRVMGR